MIKILLIYVISLKPNSNMRKARISTHITAEIMRFSRFRKLLSLFPADNYMFKVTIETLEQGVKYIQS